MFECIKLAAVAAVIVCLAMLSIVTLFITLAVQPYAALIAAPLMVIVVGTVSHKLLSKVGM